MATPTFRRWCKKITLTKRISSRYAAIAKMPNREKLEKQSSSRRNRSGTTTCKTSARTGLDWILVLDRRLDPYWYIRLNCGYTLKRDIDLKLRSQIRFTLLKYRTGSADGWIGRRRFDPRSVWPFHVSTVWCEIFKELGSRYNAEKSKRTLFYSYRT